MDYDVIVVGAGPGGVTAARAASLRGLRTLILEEHQEIGRPTHCTGKLTHHAFEEFALPPGIVVNAVSAAILYGPKGGKAFLRRRAVDSYIVDRDRFDQKLAETALEAGADLMTGARALGVRLVNDGMEVSGERNGRPFAIRGRIVVDAEGASPNLPLSLGYRLERRWVLGLQYQVEGATVESEDAPELYFGKDFAPGFFAWIMPLGGQRARVGLCVDPTYTAHKPVYYLERFIHEHPIARKKLKGIRVEHKLAGRIPILGARRPSFFPGMLLVGDAAAQVKATSGGGIYFAMVAGELAASAAARYVKGDRGALRDYERSWRRRFGREIWFTSLVRSILNQLSDEEIDAAIDLLSREEGLREALEVFGDTAYQSRVLVPVLLHSLRIGLRDRSLAWILSRFLLGFVRVWL
ncbi:MAG: NAD(P)/FAD-dependent oxidoreductase [Armatimonadota bacterium]|nr:NAD(P)/FAD-dependent oxidoreductase [Armatimonadota bacterium]